MYEQQDQPQKKFFVYALLMTAAVACDDEKRMEIKPDSPAYHIAESEKLVIPDEVKVPDDLPVGNTRIATYFASGYQVYNAQQVGGSSPAVFEWVFVSPCADLYDVNDKKIGVHFAGPTWQILTGDSRISAQQFTPVARVKNVDSASIDWLLLMPKAGTTPIGIFKDVAYIQRIATTGGRAPSAPPVAPGQIAVEYSAVYRFTKKNP